MKISDLRQKYPQYDDLSDEQLLDGLHSKYYSDMPKEEFLANFEQPQPRSYIEEAKRQLGLTGRYLAEGLANTADIVTEPIRVGLNAAGMNIPQSTTGAVQGLIRDLPQPETPLENVVQTAGKFVTSGAPFVGAGQIAAKVPGVVGQAGKTLAADPALQATSLASAGAAGQTAKEMGAGEGGQFAASLAGGLTPAGIKQASTKAVESAKVPKQFIKESVPTQDDLSSVSSQVYKEIDDMGVTVSQDAYSNLKTKINTIADNLGVDPDLTPKSFAVLKRFSEIDDSITLTELDKLRRKAGIASSQLDRNDAAIGSAIRRELDNYLDNIQPNDLITGKDKAAVVGEKYKTARDLHGRLRRSQMIDKAMSEAKEQASGFENGIRIAIRKILRDPKKSKFFNKEELSAMRRVVQGTTGSNIAKLLGRFGFSENQATNFLGAYMGIGGGAYVGGPVGAVVVPLIGQVSKSLATRLTRNNAEFADQIIRAGKNGDEIIKAYLKNTPKDQRNPDELRELLLRPDVKTPKNIDQVISNVIPISAARRVAPATSAAILANEN